MKRLAALLSFYILLISAVPVLQISYAAFSSTEKCCMKCCMEMQKKNPMSKCKSCKGMTCAICQTGCYAFCGFMTTNISIQKISVEENLFSGKPSPVFVSNYSSDCFRPPETV